ncbi:hypothetical protein [Photobacterium damselae]|uniref:hypothetical protein n=1 Tax=Photobacterium damselae TaxID=38293 RepID=UPI001F321D2F|nr:hypothetical protein [Photobacterium damselae]UKA04733.1 hypothetical protein IHC89_21060 [Photobacterium damselae subsp. damselae]
MNFKELVLNLCSLDYSGLLVELKTDTDTDFTAQIIRVNKEKESLVVNCNKIITSQFFDISFEVAGRKIALKVKNNSRFCGDFIEISESDLINFELTNVDEIEKLSISFELDSIYISDEKGSSKISCEYIGKILDNAIFLGVQNAQTAAFLLSCLDGVETTATLKLNSAETKEIVITKASRPSPNYIKVKFKECSKN